MPELPDITLYVEALRKRVIGQPLLKARVTSMFVLRTADPPLSAAEGQRVIEVRRVGKRVALRMENDIFVSMHLMVAGRLHWRKVGVKQKGLATLEFPGGALLFTEAGSRHRAAMHVVRGELGVGLLDAGGAEPLEVTAAEWAHALRRENHTIKRTLTDPRLISGIGNAYSDEILHRARMSPVLLTSRMTDEQIEHLRLVTRLALDEAIQTLRREIGDAFPEKVTAFRKDFAVHGKFGQACPACGTLVQRIVKGENESNYCPRCQTGGKMLADRALSKLLHDDWPKTIDAWEQRRMPGQG